MARYDITPVAESLLGDVRSRSGGRKDDDKDIWKVLALQLGIGIGNSIIKKNKMDFFNNKELLDTRVKVKNANADAENIFNTRKSIAASNLSDEQYFEKVIRPDLQSKYEEAYVSEGMTLKSTDAYNQTIQRQARELAVERAKAFRAAEEAAKGIKSEKDFEAFAVMANQRPSNVGGWVSDKIGSLFTGKSTPVLEAEAIEDLKETFSPDEFNTMLSVYNSTKDLSSAVEIAAMDNVEYNPRVIKTSDMKINTDDEGITIIPLTTEYDTVTEQTVGHAPGKPIRINFADDPNNVKAKFKQALDIKNLLGLFTGEGRAVIAEAAGAKGINLLDPQSNEELKFVMDTMASQMETGEYLTQHRGDKVANEMYKVIASGMTDIPALLASLEDPDSEGYQDSLKRIGYIFRSLHAVTAHVSSFKIKGEPDPTPRDFGSLTGDK